MTLSSATTRNSYTGNGAVSTYAYSFKVFDEADLLVTVRNTSDVETTLVLATDYTTTGEGETAGGNIVLVSAGQAWLTAGKLTTGYVLTVRRVSDLTQETDIRNQGSFYPEVHEDEFDKLVMVDQEQQDDLDRSVKLPETIAPADFDPTFPADLLTNSAGKMPTVNASGDGWADADDWTSPDDLSATAAAVAADAAAAAASAAAAATSETNAGVSETNAASSETAADAAQTAAEAAQTAAEAAQAAAEAAAGSSSDPDVVALAGLSTTGLIVRTGAGTATTRAVTAPAAGITVSNGDGVAGAPTLVLANDLAALEGLGSTGLAARTAADTWAQRTITAPAAGITVSNGDGVSGNPTLALANDLAAVEAMSGTGLAAHTGASTWTERTITGTANQITVTNGDGVSGNPTLSIPSDPILPGTGAVTVPAGTTAQRNGSPANGMFRYNSDLSIFEGYKGSAWGPVGSGAGGINYLSSNPDSEAATTGWTTYADAAGTSPVDGTGGSPTFTWTRSTSSPLRGTGSFLATKDAANRQGEGVAFAITLDSADQAKPICISFDYAIASGTYADGDLAVYLYDVTNSLVIQPAPYQILSATAGLSQKWIGYFQTSAASTSYRFIVHTKSTSASAYTVKFDNFNVGPTYQSYGAVATDWTAYTPTGTWSANTTFTGKWRRVGDTLEVEASAATSGLPVGNFTLNLPTGYTIDTTKLSMATPSNANTQVGFGWADDSDTTIYPITVAYNSTTSVRGYCGNASSTYTATNSVNATQPFTFGSGDSVQLRFSVPIVGWSSNVQVSSDADTRVTAAKYSSAAGQAIADSTFVALTHATKLFDTHGAVSSGAFTAPVPGIYEVAGSAELASNAGWGAGEILYMIAYVNGAIPTSGGGYMGFYTCQTTATTIARVSGKTEVQVNAGDVITVRLFQNSGGSISLQTDADKNWIAFKRATGPAQIAASEKVYLQYTGNGGAAQTADTTKMDFTTKVTDSHGAWTSSNTFTAPRAGFYIFTGEVRWTATANIVVGLFINGTKKYVSGTASGAVNVTQAEFNFATYMNQGDTADLRADTNTTLSNSATLHWLSIYSQGGI